jgi:hypothetical protein
MHSLGIAPQDAPRADYAGADRETFFMDREGAV